MGKKRSSPSALDASSGAHRREKRRCSEDAISERPRRARVFKLPTRIKSIFFGPGLRPSATITILHEQPRVYKVVKFLRKEHLAFFDRLLLNNSKAFRHSFTEDASGGKIVSDERTSSYSSFLKQENKIISELEKRAADIVGLSVDNVEPLQMVKYLEGQSFGEHHDSGNNVISQQNSLVVVILFALIGTLNADDSIELVYPRRLITFFVVYREICYSTLCPLNSYYC